MRAKGLPDGGPAFSRAKGDELWVLLLEKAWAKTHGSYLRIEAGRLGNVLEDLTGAPHMDTLWRIEGSDAVAEDVDSDALWSQLLAAEAAGFPIAASVPDIENRDMQAEFGLVEKHAYSVRQRARCDVL